jgi:hypothetical protein
VELGVCLVRYLYHFFFARGENVREIDKSDVSVAFICQQVTSAFGTIA